VGSFQITINYSSGSPSTISPGITDWQAVNGAANGEEEALILGEIAKPGSGGPRKLVTSYIYGYSLTGLDTTRTITSITLSNNNNVKILAMSLEGPSVVNGACPSIPYPTSLAINSSANTITYGANLSFTANVTTSNPSSSTKPTGNVTLTVLVKLTGAVAFTTAVPINASGTATFSFPPLAFLSANTYTVKADYSGDSNFAPSSATLSSDQVVNQDNVTISLSAVPSSGPPQTVVLTAQVQSVTNSGVTIPTGSIKFTFNGSTTPLTLSAGTASESIPNVVGGNYTFTAAYQGDTNFNTKTSNTSVTVNAAATTVSITSASPSGSATYGSSVTFNIKVSSATTGGDFSGGNVDLYNNGTKIGTGTVNSSGTGAVTLTNGTGLAATPPNKLVANYLGDTNYAASTSSPAYPYTINPASTTTSIIGESPSGTATYGATVTFNIKVTSSAAGGDFSGNVTLYNNGTAIGTGTINSTGTGSVIVNNGTGLVLSPPGINSITATYGGSSSGNYATSTTLVPILYLITPASTTTTLSISPASNTASAGATITFDVTISSSSASGPFNGSVNIVDTNTGGLLATCAITNTTTCAPTNNTMAKGSYSIQAQFTSTDTNYNGSSSSAQTYKVK
jgi:hypothetical protein